MNTATSHNLNTPLTLEEIYRAAYLEKLGATYEEFVSDPPGTLDRYGQGDAIEILRAGFRPLLPVQVRLRQQMDAADGGGARTSAFDSVRGATGQRDQSAQTASARPAHKGRPFLRLVRGG